MDYGDATFTRHDDGRVTVDRADPVIGIAVELLASVEDGGLPVDSDGCIWLAGDQRYRYRPVQFDAPGVHRPPGYAGGRPLIVVCERVEVAGGEVG